MFGMAARAAPTKEPDMVPTPSVKPASVENPNTSASQADEFRQFLESIWPKADAAGVSRATFDNAISGLTPDSAVLEKSANQADFTITIAQYLTQSVSAEGAALGHDLAASLSDPLEKIQARSGVPSEILVAFWGVESNYGSSAGDSDILRALATLAFRPVTKMATELTNLRKCLANNNKQYQVITLRVRPPRISVARNAGSSASGRSRNASRGALGLCLSASKRV
jgi:membrane-bound lytic murein transglycosylase B